MPFVAGGAPGSSRDPPGRTPVRPPLTPSPLQKKSFEKLCNLETSFSGPRLAIFMAFLRVFYGSLLRSHYFPSLRASWCRF